MFFLYMVLIIIFIVSLSVLFTRATVKIMGKLGGEAMYKLQQSAEFIVNTGGVPPFWREKAEKRLNRLRGAESPDDQVRRAERREAQRVKRRYLKQLKKLIHFADNSSTIADEEARAILMNALTAADRAWREMTPEEIIGLTD